MCNYEGFHGCQRLKAACIDLKNCSELVSVIWEEHFQSDSSYDVCSVFLPGLSALPGVTGSLVAFLQFGGTEAGEVPCLSVFYGSVFGGGGPHCSSKVNAK